MRVVVTGASSGLGREIANRLEDRGHRVVNWSLPDIDVRHRADLREAAMELDSVRVDALVNSAGINRINYLEDVSEAEWDDVMDTNAKGIFNVTQALLPSLIASKGVIVNVASNAAHVPMTASLAYNASKAAVEIMTKQLARELTKRHGISVIGIAPNRMDTPMSWYIDERVIDVRGWTLEQAREYQAATLLTGEPTPPEMVAELIVWLIERRWRTKWLTGSVIPYGV